MMGLSSMGCGGGGNSSASNLSASAPPFTVDRLNPKPNSNPLLHYPDSPYVVEPLSHPLQYAHISAPRAEPAIDPIEIINVPVSDGYRFLASASVSPSSTQWSAHNSAHGGDIKQPYYSHYAPPLVGEERLLGEGGVMLTSGLGVKSQHDYTRSLFELDYGPRWEDNVGLNDGKQAKRSEFDGNFPSENRYVGGLHDYEQQPYKGGCGSENRNKYKEDSGHLYENLIQVSEQEVYTGSSSTGYMEDTSCLEQQLGFFHYDSSKVLLKPSGSPYPESYPSAVSCSMEKDFPNYQNSHSPYEKFVNPVDTAFPDRASVTRYSPAVVIRPPPATNLNLGQDAASRIPAGIHIVSSDYTNPSKPEDFSLKPISKSKDDYFENSFFEFSKEGNSSVSPISVRELSSSLHSMDTADRRIKTTLGSQIPGVSVSSGFTLTGGNIQVVNSTLESSEFMDNHNTAVDSPCWRGATSSQFSTFDIESGNSNHVKINLGEHYGFDHGEHQSLLSTIDPNRVFSEKAYCDMGNENKRGKTGEKLGLDKTLDAACSTKEQISLDGTIDGVWIPSQAKSKEVELGAVPNVMTKEHDFLNSLTSVFDMKVSDTKHLFGEDGSVMTVNDVSEGADVAVHAAENVLASPASQEEAIEHTTVPAPELDVPAIVKTMHSLSNLLLFHISSDLCSLGEENAEILKHVISSLNTCLSKKGIRAQAANNPEPKDPAGQTSRIFEESSNAGIVMGGPHTKSDTSSFCPKPDNLQFQKEERNSKKIEIPPINFPVMDDLHMTGDDDMAKAIEKVLEQNFHINEDMHSQALLFKSLWLESEAKLCSISYKSRFERMKIQMEEIKLKSSKETTPDPISVSELAPKAHSGTFPKPASPDHSTSGQSQSQHADGIEASVLARLNILNSRDENPKPMNTEEQQQSEMDADSVMARFNILKSREENSKLINMDVEAPPQVVNDEFAGEKYFRPRIRGQSGDEALDAVALQPDYQSATGSSSVGKFNSFFERPGYESPMKDLLKSGSNGTINENNSGSNDSSSSEWEHVLKEDFSWKN